VVPDDIRPEVDHILIVKAKETTLRHIAISECRSGPVALGSKLSVFVYHRQDRPDR
jgi:hypothetical protein